MYTQTLHGHDWSVGCKLRYSVSTPDSRAAGLSPAPNYARHCHRRHRGRATRRWGWSWEHFGAELGARWGWGWEHVRAELVAFREQGLGSRRGVAGHVGGVAGARWGGARQPSTGCHRSRSGMTTGRVVIRLAQQSTAGPGGPAVTSHLVPQLRTHDEGPRESSSPVRCLGVMIQGPSSRGLLKMCQPGPVPRAMFAGLHHHGNPQDVAPSQPGATSFSNS